MKWLNDCTSHMTKFKNDSNFLTKERCMKDAKNYKKIIEWYKNNQYSCNLAKKNGWLDECTAHMTKRGNRF